MLEEFFNDPKVKDKINKIKDYNPNVSKNKEQKENPSSEIIRKATREALKYYHSKNQVKD